MSMMWPPRSRGWQHPSSVILRERPGFDRLASELLGSHVSPRLGELPAVTGDVLDPAFPLAGARTSGYARTGMTVAGGTDRLCCTCIVSRFSGGALTGDVFPPREPGCNITAVGLDSPSVTPTIAAEVIQPLWTKYGLAVSED